jgi:hypothetical protein
VKLTVPNDGTLTIEAISPKGNKIVLKRGAVLYAGNVPASSLWPDAPPADDDSVWHMEAYGHMSASLGARVTPDDPDKITLPPCEPEPPLDAGWHPKHPKSEASKGTDFQCSAVTWSAP